MTGSRPSTHPLARLQRFAKRAGSPSAFLTNAWEEAFVRAWSVEATRRMIGPLLPVRLPGKWLFLVGCYNSGTTLLQKVMSSHPAISGLPREGVRFTATLSNLEENGHHMIWDEEYRAHAEPELADAEAYRRITRDWNIFWRSGADIFLDKSVANTARIGWLDRVFPDASFIGIHRNGYCVAEGLHRRAQPPQWLQAKTGSVNYPLEQIAWQWVTANREMLDGFEQAGRAMMIRFEDLVEDPVRVFESVFGFAGVDTGVIESGQNGIVIGGRHFAVHDPNPASLARLTLRQKDELRPLIGPMMDRLGYDRD